MKRTTICDEFWGCLHNSSGIVVLRRRRKNIPVKRCEHTCNPQCVVSMWQHGSPTERGPNDGAITTCAEGGCVKLNDHIDHRPPSRLSDRRVTLLRWFITRSHTESDVASCTIRRTSPSTANLAQTTRCALSDCARSTNHKLQTSSGRFCAKPFILCGLHGRAPRSLVGSTLGRRRLRRFRCGNSLSFTNRRRLRRFRCSNSLTFTNGHDLLGFVNNELVTVVQNRLVLDGFESDIDKFVLTRGKPLASSH